MHAAILSRRDDSKRWRDRPWNDALDLICLASLAPFRRWSMKIIAQPLRPSHSWTWFFAEKKKQVHPRRGASCLDGKKPTAPPVPKDSHSFRISSVRRKTPRQRGGEGGVCEPADGVRCGERIGGGLQRGRLLQRCRLRAVRRSVGLLEGSRRPQKDAALFFGSQAVPLSADRRGQDRSIVLADHCNCHRDPL